MYQSLYRGPAFAEAVDVLLLLLLLLEEEDDDEEAVLFKTELTNRAAMRSATPPMTVRTKSCAAGSLNASERTLSCFCVFSKSMFSRCRDEEDFP